MGAVISNNVFEPDTANLVHPDGHSVGSDMATEIERFRDDIKGAAMIAYAEQVQAHLLPHEVLVEEFDADQHQFAPVEIEDKSFARHDTSHFFIFNCRTVLNTGDPTAFSITSGGPFRMFKDKIGGVGLWQELRCLLAICASEAFLDEVENLRLRGVMRQTEFAEF